MAAVLAPRVAPFSFSSTDAWFEVDADLGRALRHGGEAAVVDVYDGSFDQLAL